MSHYPYSYGQYPGLPPPPPPQSNQYAYAIPPAYPPAPSYDSQHDPNAAAPAANYYAMTQSAYDYNSSVAGIPGLGIGGTPTAGTPYQPPPPLPHVTAWGQHPVNQQPPQVAPGAVEPPSQYQYCVPAQFNGPADQAYHPRSHNAQSLPAKQTAVSQLTNAATQSSEEMEEGELSEGQFEDLYEPVDPPAKSQNVAVAPNNVPSVPVESQPTSAVDTPSGGFYSNEEEDAGSQGQPVTGGGAVAGGPASNVDTTQEPAAARERSGSYSPYLSPREIHNASIDNDDHSLQSTNGTRTKAGRVEANGRGHLKGPGLSQPANNGAQALHRPKSPTSHNHTQHNHPNNNSPNESSASDFKSLAEARKEAQKAILKLWPHGVRSEHYITEGIDEKVVKSLFTALHLDFSTGKPMPPDTTSPSQQVQSSEPLSAVPAGPKSPVAERKTLASPQSSTTKPSKDEKMDKSEERKDRIARLLALKAAKGPSTAPAAVTAPAQPAVSAVLPATSQLATEAHVSKSYITAASTLASAQHPDTTQASVVTVVNPTLTAPSSATSTPTGAKPKTKTKEEIERLLRQKMEALQKSRELNARKAGSDSVPSSTKAGATETVTLQPTTAVSVNPATRNAFPQEHAVRDKGPVPAPVLSLAPQALQTVNVRKRPVASDFVDYPAADSLKRPFGQKRQNTSLVIDVSDGSDDEEMDMDMDMDSPDEAPLPIPRSNTPGRKGPSLAEFPPLRDLSRRNVSSPAPSASTTPGPMSTKDRELLAKERAIQEMKRKIAELEAQKKAKKGSQTPSQVAATPPESNENDASQASAPGASSVVADKVDAASAQLISEAVSARLPKPSAPGPKETAQNGRSQSANASASRVIAAKEEKKKQLAALREAQAAKKRELEEKWKAEQARLAEDEAKMRELEAELEQDAQMDDGSDDDNQSERMSVDDDSDEEASEDEHAERADDPQATVSGQALTPLPLEKQLDPGALVSGAADCEQHERVVTDAPATRSSAEPQAATSGADSSETDDVGNARGTNTPSTTSDQSLRESSAPIAEDVSTSEETQSGGGDAATRQSTTHEYQASEDEPSSKASLDHVAIPDSPEFSPEPAELTTTAAGSLQAQSGGPVPATISDVPRSRDDTQEIEAPHNRRPLLPKPSSSFVPYESPLRYFRAFRFHPEFNRIVPGGVKSLTYSNKIDPRKELCSDELQGDACPRGKACQFQHLTDIRVSDDQILVELGKADDYVGEQKERFIQGLKDLLQDFRAKKIRDFDTIVNGIIEYRARFLGDKSKILPLKDVTL